MRKAYRVKKEREFQAVFHTGDSFANRKFVVYRLEKPGQPHFRVGLSVGKKVGNAVNRNEVKRKIRAAVYSIKEEIDPELDFIVIARPSVKGLTYDEVRSNLVHVLKLAKIIDREEVKKYKRLLLMAGIVSLVIVLSGCGTGEVSAQSTGLWDRYIVYYFAEAIKALSFGNAGIGIILFTLIIRVILLPLMHFQTKSMRKTQELQPKLKALQQQYSSRDPETQSKLREEQQRLYAENGVNPYAGCLPLLVQMPILMAIYFTCTRVETRAFLMVELRERGSNIYFADFSSNLYFCKYVFI